MNMNNNQDGAVSGIETFIEPSRQEWTPLTERNKRNDADIDAVVKEVFEDVRRRGDEALLDYENRFDKAGFSEPSELLVSEEEKRQAADSVPENLKLAIAKAWDNILAFHKAQLPGTVEVETQPGVRCFQRPVPISRVGFYIPGGRAPLFSTVLMLAAPAKVAGCPDIMLCTPPGPKGKANAVTVYAAQICGINKIFKTGGSQAIAAMAIGTQTISKRDKIFGPGNRFVMKAKQLASISETAIDMPAGPSEVMVLADESCDPEFVASDFLSQAEHGPDSQSILVCTSPELAKEVKLAISAQLASLSRSEIMRESLSCSKIVVLGSQDDVIAFANEYAPEHLIISMKDAWAVADRITAAGSVFIGNYSPESAGDYASGTNHTLPTSGWARSFSGLNVDSFMRKMTIQELSADGLSGLSEVIRTMALAEGLDAHAAAVEVRLNKIKRETL